MADYEVSPAARDDLVGIWVYVFDLSDSYDRAKKVNAEFYKTFALLAEMPGMGRTHDGLDPDTRVFFKLGYAILYRQTPSGVFIARLIGGEQDLAEELQRG